MLSVIYISISQWNKHTRQLPSWKIESFWLKKLLRLGIPSAGQLSLEVFAFNFTTVLVASLGAQKMATHHIILSLSSFTFMIPLGQSVSTAVRVGYHIGRKEHELAEACGWFNIIAGSIFMLSSSAMFLIFPETLINLFTNDPEVVILQFQLYFYVLSFNFLMPFRLLLVEHLEAGEIQNQYSFKLYFTLYYWFTNRPNIMFLL